MKVRVCVHTCVMYSHAGSICMALKDHKHLQPTDHSAAGDGETADNFYPIYYVALL